MALILVGGQAKDIGKTTLICNIIAAFPSLQWSAVKITNHRHDPPGCELRSESKSWSIWEQVLTTTESDTSRFIHAGARRAWLVRAEDAALEEAYAALRTMLSPESNLIVESNRLRAFLNPDLFLLLVEDAQAEFKASARNQLKTADAIVWRGIQGIPPPDLPMLSSKPAFQTRPTGLDVNLALFIRARLRIRTD